MAKKKISKSVKSLKSKVKKSTKAAPAAAAENNLDEEFLEDQPEERAMPTSGYDDEEESTESNW